MRRLVFITGFLLVVISAWSQDLEMFQKHLYVNGRDTMPYRLLMPENYDASKKYPLILFLHGAGERGNDNQKQLIHGAKLFLSEDYRKNYQAIVLFPQCANNSWWSNTDVQYDSVKSKITLKYKEAGDPTPAMNMVQQLLRKIMEEYPVNKKQVYVGGLSMGGMGTFEIVRRNPKLFAAAFPICGGANPATAKKLKKVSWWVFHGDKDDAVPFEHSEQMVNALKAINASVRFTLYPDVKHNSWDPAFREPELLKWLFSRKK